MFNKILPESGKKRTYLNQVNIKEKLENISKLNKPSPFAPTDERIT